MPAASSSSAPSATSRAASTTSSAGAPAVRATPASRASILSLEDDLMRIFAKQWVSTLLERLGMEEGVPIESKHDLQPHRGRAESRRSAKLRSRKHLLEYDDVMNKQREAVYGVRRALLEGVDQKELILEDYVGEDPQRNARRIRAGEPASRPMECQGHSRANWSASSASNLTATGHQRQRAQPPRTWRRNLRQASKSDTKPRKDPRRDNHALSRAHGDAQRD